MVHQGPQKPQVKFKKCHYFCARYSAGFRRVSIDSTALKSMLELCLDSFKSGIERDHRVGRWERGGPGTSRTMSKPDLGTENYILARPARPGPAWVGILQASRQPPCRARAPPEGPPGATDRWWSGSTWPRPQTYFLERRNRFKTAGTRRSGRQQKSVTDS